MKCKNCGAELTNGKCEYCGSVFTGNMLYIPKPDPKTVADILTSRSYIIKGDCNKDNDSVMKKVQIREV